MTNEAAVSIAVSGWSTHFWLSLCAQFCGGLVLPFIQTALSLMMMQNTEQSFVGRVNGFLSPLLMVSMVVTMSIAGWLKSWLSITAVYQLAAVLLAAGTPIMLPLFLKNMQPTQVEATAADERFQKSGHFG